MDKGKMRLRRNTTSDKIIREFENSKVQENETMIPSTASFKSIYRKFLKSLFPYCLISLLFIPLSSFSQLLDSLTLDSTTACTSMAEALREPEKVIKLDLTKKKLSELPADISKLKNLQWLDLGKNKIKVLSPEIGELTNLQYLNLERNKMDSVPPEIGKLQNLKYLIINRNELRDIPKEIGLLTNLEMLDLWENNLSTLPDEIKHLTHLKMLEMRAILLTDAEMDHIKSLLPQTTIFFSPSCNCKL